MKLSSGLAAVALAATTLTVASPASAAETAGDRAVSAGATWLTSQLTAGILHNEEYDYDDLGLSADVAFALDAVGGHDATVTQIADAVAPDVTDWYDSYGTRYTGSAAKAIALAQVAGKDATDFGGQDLQAVVEDTVGTTEPIIGRVQNQNEFDYMPPYSAADSLNVISQSWAARGLTGQDSDLADEVMAFLLDQQCDDGSFRAGLTKDKAATEQGCATGVVGEVDTTALTVLNILGTPGASVTAKGAAHLAASWLKTQQLADGSFSAGALGTNANTTGLAGWALAEAGHEAAATRAASWLRGLQVADLAPCATALAGDNGAILLKSEEVPAVRTAGSLDVPTRERARRATAQALPALANAPAGGDVTVSAPATAAENTTVTVTVTGLGAGEPACASFGGQAKQITGTGSPVAVTFTLPAGAATHTFAVATLGGTSTATTNATVTPVPVPTPTSTPTPTATPTPTPAPEPQVGALETKRVVKVSRNRFAVSIACEGGTQACAGNLTVRTARKVEMRSGKRVVTVAKREYTVAAGEEKRLVVRLTKAGRAALADGKVRVEAVQKARDAERVVTTFWLKRA